MTERERMRQRRLAGKALTNRLKAVPCADCGGEFDPVAMDFDHVDGAKACGISRMVRNGAGEAAILREVAKCEVVCSNCHRVRTAGRL